MCAGRIISEGCATVFGRVGSSSLLIFVIVFVCAEVLSATAGQGMWALKSGITEP